MTILRDLPPIITHPGFYRTREGLKAYIHTIDPRQNIMADGFAGKGGIERLYRGRMISRGHYVWHLSGRYYPAQESPLDIVGRWEH